MFNKTIQYQPWKVCKIIKVCGFLWNFGILTGDNKGYDPDEFIIQHKCEYDEEIESTFGGHLWREALKRYLWANIYIYIYVYRKHILK